MNMYEHMFYEIGKYCAACGVCAVKCPAEAIVAARGVYHIDTARCTGCGRCYRLCRAHAIERRPRE